MARVSTMLSTVLIAVACLTGGTIFLLIAFYVLLWSQLWSQSSSMEDYLATVESAATRLPVAVEFEKLFPGQTDHFITHYGFNRYGGDRTNTWNSEAYFDGRYSLTMQIEVVVDYRNNTVTPAGEPKFYLWEHYSVDDKDSSSKVREIAKFGEEEWSKIYSNGGDFSTIGVSMLKDSPVPNFGPMVQAWRRPRLPVTLLDKKPAADEEKGDGAQ